MREVETSLREKEWLRRHESERGFEEGEGRRTEERSNSAARVCDEHAQLQGIDGSAFCRTRRLFASRPIRDRATCLYLETDGVLNEY